MDKSLYTYITIASSLIVNCGAFKGWDLVVDDEKTALHWEGDGEILGL